MCRLQSLKVFISQRLAAAVDEIFGHFERTITEYEEEMSRRHTLLDAASQLTLTPQRAEFPADVQQLLVGQEEGPPEQQERSSGLDQEDPPELPHIKEEQEDLFLTSQGGEQVQGLEEADITMFTFPVMTEDDDEEKPQSSQLHQSQTEESREAALLKTEADGEDCGGSEPPKTSDPDSRLQPDSFVKTSHFSEPETANRNYYWMETREPQPDLGTPNSVDPINDMGCNTGAKSYSCSECGKRFGLKGTLQRHMRRHTGEKPFSCSVCNVHFCQKVTLEQHMRIHTGEKPFSCSVCGKRFTQKGHLKCHMTVHTGEKPFSCSVCERRFTRQARVKNHKCVVENSSSL